jgi:ribosomal-protein-alanine N-acetyltransferase
MTLTKLLLKKPNQEQLQKVAELDQMCLQGLWSLKSYQKELESPNSSLIVLALRQGEREQIIGSACFWAILEEAHITVIAVHPEYQSQGLGKLLLYGVLRDAVARNLERATLEVRDGNVIALSLYEKFGFKVAGHRKGYYQKTGEDALILWRSGLHYPEFKLSLAEWCGEISDRLSRKGWVWEDTES